ncbi:MAG: type II toxin-antitoxin system VapC family toxin [Acidimicrobiaceae bacterium]|nr:type II toxin-antitoxin system VapC family toxin [Acidimicrobiaceae bacterium]
MVWYLDTSAFLKLITLEDESQAMRSWFRSHNSIWSSHLLHAEALRAGARLGISSDIIEDALDTVSLVLPSSTTFFDAGRLPPTTLRAIDALHLAAAMEIGDDLEGIVAYDGRLIEAAHAASIEVFSPR